MRAQAVEQYYPQEFKFTPRILGRLFPGLTFHDEEREQWEEDIEEYHLLLEMVCWQSDERDEAKDHPQSALLW